MKLCGSPGAVAVAACLFVAVLLGAGQAQTEYESRPIEGLRLPLEHYEDGKVKTELKAGAAFVPAEGDIQAENVTVEFFDAEGVRATLIRTDSCRYRRREGVVTSESKVRLERPGVVIRGTGFEWRIENQVVKILKNARVEFNRSVMETENLHLPGVHGGTRAGVGSKGEDRGR